ncbi:MAG: NAD-dependent DNA ligase LigA [Candidatus Omnitrophota bacterium]
MKSVKHKIEVLRKEILRHNELYYTKAEPEISDSKYDALMRKLETLEENNPEYITPDSPTETVGSPVPDKFVKVTHTVPMLSLESVNDEAGVEHFGESCVKEAGSEIHYMCEPKLDGISIELVYENGRVVRGSTRGNGRVGEDVTLNLKTIQDVPVELKGREVPEYLSVRAEVIMHIKDFQQLNKNQIEQGKEAFANPRNVAAGSMRQLDYRITARRKLRVYCYQILSISEGMPKTQEAALELLEKLGFHAAPEAKLCPGIKEVISYHHNMEKKRDSLDYEIDGIVVKVNDAAVQEKLGTRTNNPRWALAYKFKPRKEITRVEDIVVQVGRTGVLTPLALLKPVEVGGVTVARATLHNMDQVIKLGVKIGDYVKVERAGDVIPYISEVETLQREGKEKEFHMPAKCPSCGARVAKEDVFYRCPAGLACSSQLKRTITHYAAKDAADIEGFSDKTVELLFEKGLIKKVSDLYTLKRESLLSLEGWKEKKTDNILRAIDKSKNISLGRFIFGLGIKNVGSHIANVLADTFGTLEKIMSLNKEEVTLVKEIGPEIAESITAFFNAEQNIEEIISLKKMGLRIRQRNGEKSGRFSGKKIVLTGSLQSLTRSEAKKMIESQGGEVLSSVTSSTDFVVAGEKPGTKLDEAEKKGIKVISEEEFKTYPNLYKPYICSK